LNHETHVAQRRNIGRGIFRDSDEIGDQAGRDATDLVLDSALRSALSPTDPSNPC